MRLPRPPEPIAVSPESRSSGELSFHLGKLSLINFPNFEKPSAAYLSSVYYSLLNPAPHGLSRNTSQPRKFLDGEGAACLFFVCFHCIKIY